MYTRYAKIGLVFAVSLYSALFFFNSISGYWVHFNWVAHVLRMDTTQIAPLGSWRAIYWEPLYHICFALLLYGELLVALLCGIGGCQLFRARHDAVAFNANKGLTILGLTLGVMLWFSGVATVGGLWFLMAFSDLNRGQAGAMQSALVLMIVLVYVAMKDYREEA